MPAKPFLHPLKTPKTATFPSELNDDNTTTTAKTPSTTPDTLKHEPGTATPITPPTAYTEFLKAMTPVFSPVSAGTSFPRFQFDKPAGPTSAPTPTSTSTSTSQPASAVSGSFGFHEREPVKSATLPLPLPPPPAIATGSGPGAGAGAGSGAIRKHQSLRRLRIPPSMHLSPITTTATDSPRSATTLRSPFSPSDWKLRYLEPRSATTATSAGSGSGRSVSVRQVVTRTVTYKRMQLEAPPKGKRRKYHEGKDV